MKTIFKSLLLVALLLPTVAAVGQAKKPKIMVVPAQIWCNRNGYTMDYNDMGQIKKLPDYQRALENNSDMRLLISALADFMAKNDYPIESLEQKLKQLQADAAVNMALQGKDGSGVAESPIDKLMSTAKPDIILDIDFESVRRGPQTQIKFNLQAIDAYSNKIISGNTGHGTPGSSADLTEQLQEAVLSFKDNFLLGLTNHFDKMFQEGREVVIVVQRTDACDIDFEEEYDGDELGKKIESYLDDNTVQGRYSTEIATENLLRFEQVRIPLFKDNNGKQKALDTRAFASDLEKYIRKITGIKSKIVTKGLGQAIILLGGK